MDEATARLMRELMLEANLSFRQLVAVGDRIGCDVAIVFRSKEGESESERPATSPVE